MELLTMVTVPRSNEFYTRYPVTDLAQHRLERSQVLQSANQPTRVNVDAHRVYGYKTVAPDVKA